MLVYSISTILTSILVLILYISYEKYTLSDRYFWKQIKKNSKPLKPHYFILTKNDGFYGRIYLNKNTIKYTSIYKNKDELRKHIKETYPTVGILPPPTFQ